MPGGVFFEVLIPDNLTEQSFRQKEKVSLGPPSGQHATADDTFLISGNLILEQIRLISQDSIILTQNLKLEMFDVF